MMCSPRPARYQKKRWHAHVSASSGEVVSLVDWVADAAVPEESSSYRVFPLGMNDPLEGDRKLVVDPSKDLCGHSKEHCDLGWHNRGPNGGKSELTIGNNVYAQENLAGSSDWENNHRPKGTLDSSTPFVTLFNSPLNLTLAPVNYIDASIINLFYWNNVLHDVFYAYGFDEVSGNFQEYNFGKGGRDGDAVQANAQDGSGYSNAVR